MHKRCTLISCTGYFLIPEKKPTANRRESRKPLACSQNRICCSSLSLVVSDRKAKPCSAEGEPVRKPSVCSPTRVYDPCLSAHPAQHDGSSLHRDRSGKSCRRPSASQWWFPSPSHLEMISKRTFFLFRAAR